MPYDLRVLQHARRAERVGGGKRDAHVERTERRVELATDVGFGVPAEGVVGRHLRIPLRHRVVDALAAVAPAAPRLERNLRLERHLERRRATGGDRAREVDLHYGVVHLERHGDAILCQRSDPLESDFVRPELEDARHDPAVRVGEVPVALRHHRGRLESVEVEVVEHLPERIGAMVRIVQTLGAGQTVTLGIEPHVHFVRHGLLPRWGLLGVERGRGEQAGEQNAENGQAEHER